ncbi:MAG: fumarylacetoacetate hydrolase family protein [Pirellulales bacterium]
MKLAKFRRANGEEAVGVIDGVRISPLALTAGQYETLADILESDNPATTVEFLTDAAAERYSLADVTMLAPIDDQEVWAAGVTYRRSKQARMDESESAARFYDMVYEAPRPELFYKANALRVSGPNAPVRIRADSKWNVPEPELALVLNSRLNLVGYTIGNDMSSRDIEGENPLYLPQAKVYYQCCGLGPCVTLASDMPPIGEVEIRISISRSEIDVFSGETNLRQMARTFDELIEYLGRDNTFPNGVFLLTGTGIVPADDFTLRKGDRIEISIDGIGTLVNHVVQG